MPDIDLSEWDVVFCHGLTILGRKRGESLSPVWLLDKQLMQDPRTGETAYIFHTVPFLGGLDSLNVPKGALHINATAFRIPKIIEGLIRNGLHGEQEMRAKVAGIILPQ